MVVVLIGLVITTCIGGVLWVISDVYTEDPGLGFIGWGALVFIDALATIYLLVQFVRWAWLTPISLSLLQWFTKG